MKKSWIILLIVIGFISCDNKITYENEPKDVEQANDYGTKIYQLMMRKEYHKIYEVCENDEKKKELKKALKFRDSLLGVIKNASIHSIKTVRTKKSDSTYVKYFIESNIEYLKGKTNETIELYKYDTNRIVFKSYHYRLQ